jgi:hypothetical protein
VGCGRHDWADLFDHVVGLVDEAEDAGVRDHLASCDACRADSGELMVLAESLRWLGEVTEIQGREAFADQTRSDVRGLMGETRAVRATGAWRAISSESQRLRRVKLRRRLAAARAAKVSVAVFVVLAVLIGLAFALGAVDYVVDRYGHQVESTLGVDLSSLGLRPGFEEVAELAAAGEGKEKQEVTEAIERLQRREFATPRYRPQALLMLEFAATLSREGRPDQTRLVVALIEGASGAEEEPDGPSAEELRVVRKARDLWRAGEHEEALAMLDLLAAEGSPIAAYFCGAIMDEIKEWKDAEPRFVSAAERHPCVWVEIAWRWLRRRSPERARVALDRAPAGAVREAAEEIVSGAEG